MGRGSGAVRVLAGDLRGRRLAYPRDRIGRPTMNRTKESVFNSLQRRVRGVVFVDLFAAAGGVGIEALSRGADEAHFVETHPEAVRCLQENLSGLRVADRAVVHEQDAFTFVAERLDEVAGDRRAIVWADPPYEGDEAVRLLAHFAATAHPAVDLVIIEHRGDLPAEGLGRLRVLREKRFGETTVTFYEPVGEDA